MSVEFLPKQYARSSDVLKCERTKTDNLLRREMERMDKERRYVLNAVDRDQRRFQRSLEELQSRAERERGTKGLNSLRLPGGASPMLSRHMYSKPSSFDSSFTHPLSTTDASTTSASKFGAVSHLGSPFEMRRRAYSTNSSEGRSPSGITRSLPSGYRNSPPVSAARSSSRLSEPARLTAPKSLGSSAATTSGASWGQQRIRNLKDDEARRRPTHVAPLVFIDNPSPRGSPAIGRNSDVVGKAASIADMRGDVAMFNSAYSPTGSATDLSDRNGLNGERRKKLPHLSVLSRPQIASSGGLAAADKSDGGIVQDVPSASRLNLKLVRSKVLFQDGHALAVSLPRLTAATRPPTARPEENHGEEESDDVDGVDSEGLTKGIQGVNAQGGKSLAELFEEIKHCRYIRHYRPDGTLDSDDGTQMAWPES